MRKVVSPSEVAHLFANQSQDEARNQGGSFFFEKDKIFSYGYHFCIARFHKGKLLFTKKTYSKTTSKHINHVWSATRQHDHIMCYDPSSNYGSSNFSAWENDIDKQLALLGKARKPELYLSELSRLIDEVKKYAEFMEFEIPTRLKEMVDSTEVNAMLLSEAAKIAEVRKQQAKLEKERVEQEVERFRTFEVSRVHGRGSDIDYLRVSEEGGFETSQGISLSIEEGLRLYMAIKLGKLKRGDNVLHYTVRSIDEKMLVVGCHNIPIKEIDMVIDSNIEVLKACAEKLSLAVTFATSISQQQ